MRVGHGQAAGEIGVGDKAYIYMAIGVVGTTIAPWMQFYLQSSIVEKGIRVKDYAASRLDVIVAACSPILWLVHCGGLRGHALRARMGAIQVASDAAEAMRPLAGDYAFLLSLSASSTPRCSPRPFCRSQRPTRFARVRLESGVDKSFKEAPFFYWLYTLLIVGGAATVLLLPDAQLINFAILSRS